MRIYKRKGSPNWWATWNGQNGRRHRKSTGTNDKELAQAITAKWQQESFLEQHFGVIPDVPFQDVLVRYAEEKQLENPDGYHNATRHRLQYLLDWFDGRNLSEINAAAVQDFADCRRRKVKEGTVQKDLHTLKAILNKAFREERLAVVPPFPRMKPQKGRTRWLTLEEERKLLAASAVHIRTLIAIAIDTGGRRSELLNLDWRDVDMTRRRLTFTKTKNGEARTLRLTKRAHAVLTEIGPKDQGPVFTYQGKPFREFKRSFDVAREKAGLVDFRFHDLRHTFASRLVQQGVPLYEVMQLTGHKSFQMVQRYAHLAPDYQERAIKALDDYGNPSETDGHDLGTTADVVSFPKSAKSLKEMVGAAGIEPATPAV